MGILRKVSFGVHIESHEYMDGDSSGISKGILCRSFLEPGFRTFIFLLAVFFTYELTPRTRFQMFLYVSTFYLRLKHSLFLPSYRMSLRERKFFLSFFPTNDVVAFMVLQ